MMHNEALPFSLWKNRLYRLVGKLTMCSLLAMIGLPLYAQPVITGMILDRNSNAPVPFASVYEQSTKAFTSSDTRGIFQLHKNISASETLAIDCIGYQPARVSIPQNGASDTLVIYMEPSFIRVDEVTVTATRRERILKEVPVLTRTISRVQIEMSGMSSITDIINNYSASTDFYNEGRGMTFRTQGLSTKYTLFLVDGERIAGENRDNIDYYRLNANQIERVEIIPGASSSLYGSNAIGSVINLITKVPTKPLELQLNSRYSNYNELDHSVNIGGNQGKFTHFTSLQRRTSEGYDNTPETPDLYTVDPFEIHSLFNKLHYQINEKTGIESRISLFAREKFNAVSSIPSHPLYTDIAGGLKITRELLPGFHTNMSLYRDNYNSYDVLERRNNERRMNYRNTQTTGKILLFTEPQREQFVRQSFTGGIEFFVDDMYAERIEDSTRTNKVSSLFIQDEIKLGDRISLVAGARADFNSEYGNTLSPKLSAMYTFERFNIRTSYARGIRAPSIKERFYDFDIGFVTIIGNKELVPEQSNYLSMSLEYQVPNHNITLNGYRNNVNNMIYEMKIEESFNGYTYKNIANVAIHGIDLITRNRLFDGLNLVGTYSLVDAKDRDTGTQLVGTSRHTATITADYMKRWKRVTSGLTLTTKIHGKKEFVNMDYITAEMFEDTYPTYAIWRLSTYYFLFNQSVKIQFGLDNLLNYKAKSDLICNDAGRRGFVSLDISIDKLYHQLK